jgi:hypothetical protein
MRRPPDITGELRRENQVEAPLLVTCEEAARRIGVDRVSKNPARVVQQMARRGELRAVLVGRWRMIEARSIDSWLSTR